MKSLRINRLCLYSFLSLLLFICFNSAAIYYEKPSSARLAAASQKPPACTYQAQKYQHGQQVPTAEPCLNCTCRKGVLLCFLRVCPTLIQSNPNDNCITVREPGQCCPTLKCETIIQNDSNTTPSIPTTKSLSGFSQTLDNQSLNNEKTDALNGANNTTPDNPHNNSIYYFSDFKNFKPEKVETKNDDRVSVTQKDRTTTIFQTSPSTTFHESLLLATSSPASTLVDSEENMITNAEGTCQLNGTFYAEGSAVASTSFCEYCYCIRSKRMCIRPRCHLSILGCFPRYTSEYACCPTSYVCGNEAMTTLPMTTSTTTTTTTSTTTVESIRIFGRKAACTIDGIEYKVGEPIGSDEHCMQCYCSTGGIKKCKKIQCSPEMEGCVPVIPEGHCCPVEYKCNSTLEVTKSSVDLEISINTEYNSDSSPITTQQNINDLTEIGITINPSDISDQLTTETNFETNENSLINNKMSANSSNLNETNIEILNDSVTVSPLEEAITKESLTKTETLVIQTESIINGQQMRSDDLVIKNDDQNYLNMEFNTNTNRTDTSIDSLIETTTDKNDYQTVDYFKNEIKPDLYTENQTIITNDIEVTTKSVITFVTDSPYGSNLSLISESGLNSTKNLSIETNNELLPNISNESLNISTKTNEDNDTKLIQTNETSYDSVGVILQGIIHAIDKQLQRRIPAEPRLKNNSSDESSESKQLNDTQKPMTYRSESKAGPSLSSSFFITDDNEAPYKSGSDGIEIITAKTAFYDLHENPGDSILINLTPSSLKVSASPHSPYNHNLNPPNDKKFDIIGQNNRAAIYGRPMNPFPQPYLQSNNDWRAVNSDFPRRPQFEVTPSPSKSVESLYYTNNNRRQDTDENIDKNNSDFDKRPRLEFENPIDLNNRMKVIPFKVNDAVAGLSNKRKNGSFLIRVSSPNKNSLSPDPNSKPNQQISCFFNNLEYPNGAMIPKSDPCTLCRCFYGRELCQQQKCPSPPEKDCVPEMMNGYCCPRYICRIIEETKITPNSQTIDALIHSNPDSLNSSPIRKSPQFLTEIKNNLMNETNIEMNFPKVLTQNQENNFEDKNINEDNKSGVRLTMDSPTPPSRYNLPAVVSSVKPFNRISGINSKPKPNDNRIHFPIDKEIDSVVSQPLITDGNSPFAPNSRPSKPVVGGSHHSQYNNANKFRLKPSPTMTQSSQSLSPLGSPQKPNLRLPPFLLHTHSGANSPPNNRHKHNITSHSDETLTKSEIINRTNISLTDNEKNQTIIATDFITHVKHNSSHEINSLTPEYHSTPSSSESNISLTTISYKKLTSIPTPTIISSTISSITNDFKPKEQIKDSSDPNKNQNPWDLFRVSGCNIYGTMYEINTKIERLSTSCKNCICSAQGVKCTDIC